MNPHRVEVFDGANNNAVVLAVPHHLHLKFFPADQRLVDQEFVGWRKIEPPPANIFEFLAVVGDAATGTTHSKRRPDDTGKTELIGHLQGLLQAVHNVRAGGIQTDCPHGLIKLLPVFRLVDRAFGGADQFHTELLEDAFSSEIQRAIQGRLAAHGGQQCIRPFFLDDFRYGAPLDRLDVSGIGHHRVGHDRGRIGIDQHHTIALFEQGLAGLGAGVIKLTGLANDDRTRTENQNTVDITSFRHAQFASRRCAIRSTK